MNSLSAQPDPCFTAGVSPYDPSPDFYVTGCDVIPLEFIIRDHTASSCQSVTDPIDVFISFDPTGYQFVDLTFDLPITNQPTYNLVTGGSFVQIRIFNYDIEAYGNVRGTLKLIGLEDENSPNSIIKIYGKRTSESTFLKMVEYRAPVLGTVVSGNVSTLISQFVMEDANFACGNTLPNHQYYVEDDLIVDVDYCMFAQNTSVPGRITVAPGAKIIVEDGVIFSLSNMIIEGCGSMWRGFDVRSGGVVIFESSSLAHAEIGFNVEAGGEAYVVAGSTLSQNVIGIKNSGTVGVYSSTITSEATGWQPDFAGQQYSRIGDRAILGIWNEQDGLANIFQSSISVAQCGIHNENAELRVEQSHIEDMIDLGNPIADFGGVGINLDHTYAGYFAKVIGNTPGVNNFENLDVGIKVRGARFDCENTKMDDLDIGVDIQETRTGGQIMSGNDIRAREFGIQVLNSYPNRTEISNNTIEIIPGGNEVERSCIILKSNAAPIRVIDNTLNLGQAVNGVFSQTNFVPYYRNNTANMSVGISKYGFRSEGETVPRYLCNTAQGGGTSINNKGFSWANATSYIIQCNEAYSVSDGFNFNQTNTGQNRFRGNECDGQQPLVVENGGTMSQQMHMGNCFSGGLVWNQNPVQTDVRASQFTAEDANAGLNCDLFPDNRVPVSDDWFEDEGGEHAFACSSSPRCPSGTGSSFDPCHSPAYVDHILNHLSLVDPAQQYYLELQIMVELEESGCTSLAPTLDAFVNSQSGTVREAVKDIILDLPQLSANYQDLQDSVVLWLQERSGMIETLIEMKLDEEADPIAITDLETQIAALTQQIQTSATQMTNEYTSTIQSLKSALHSATAPTLHDTRLKTVFTRLLEYAEGTQSSWTAGDIDDLEAIAELCPFEGNIATFVARGVLSSIAPATYDDTALCQSSDLRQDPNSQAKQLGVEVDLVGMTITPNPANSQVVIVVDQSLLNGNITLVNAIGQTVLSQSIQDVKTVTLDISAIGPGWYQVLIENEGQILAREKLLIVHD